MTVKKVPRSVGVHDGTFHADEVTACALLVLFDLVDEENIIRSRDPSVLDTCDYVCDVGGIYEPARHLFDHHQADYRGRLSSAGMILQFLRDEKLMTEDEYRLFNDSLIIGVDDHDNGIAPLPKGYCSFSNVVSNFTPVNHDVSAEEQYDAFMEAYRFVLRHLRQLLARFRYVRACRGIVAERMKQDRDCLMFEQSIPWLESFFEEGGKDHPALFVIMPSGEHWKLRGIPPSMDDRMSVRRPLPKKWAGLLDEDLQNASGINGAIFCHKGRFISVWKTKEDALEALKYTMKRR